MTAGGSYPADAATTYQTSSGTAHTNPIVLDSAGRIPGSSEIYIEPGTSQKWILTTSADVAVWTQDNIAAIPPSVVNVDVSGLAGQALAAGKVVYLSNGSGGTTDGSWYLADAAAEYSSINAVTVGMTPNAIASGSSGTIRLQGQVTVAGPLAPGDSYYILDTSGGGTAGSLTATAPTFARFVGQADTTTSIVIVPNPVASNLMDILQVEVFI